MAMTMTEKLFDSGLVSDIMIPFRYQKGHRRMIKTTCTACGRQFKLKDSLAGKQGKCGCGAVVAIPFLEEYPQSEYQEPAAEASPEVDEVDSAVETPVPAGGPDDNDVAAQSWTAKLKPYRSIGAVGLIIAGIVGFGAYRYHRIQSDLDEQIDRRAQQAYQMYSDDSDQLAKQAAADHAAAAGLRARAQQLREEADTPIEPPRPRLTRDEAIENDPYIMSLLDDHPELRRGILDGSIIGSPTLPLMVSLGSLRPSDVSYISHFSMALQQIPR